MTGTRYTFGFLLLGSGAWYLAAAFIAPMTGDWSIGATLGQFALAAICIIAGLWIWPKPSRF